MTKQSKTIIAAVAAVIAFTFAGFSIYGTIAAYRAHAEALKRSCEEADAYTRILNMMHEARVGAVRKHFIATAKPVGRGWQGGLLVVGPCGSYFKIIGPLRSTEGEAETDAVRAKADYLRTGDWP